MLIDPPHSPIITIHPPMKNTVTASRRPPVILTAGAALALICLPRLFAQEVVAPPVLEEVEAPPVLESLRFQVVPEPSNLGDFVRNRNAAIALGKALFWDSQVGSDGVTACATCHFHAGADNRSKNQVSPGLLDHPLDSTFQVGGPNCTLRVSDFPFHKLKNVNDRRSEVLRSSNDVSSSQGVIFENFLGLDSSNEEIRTLKPDAIFQVNGLNTRRVEPRNTPTVINAVFNKRNFWDGRAQAIFNGVNPFGLRDSELSDNDPNKAFVWKSERKGLLEVRVALDNSSLASQAVGPPLSSFEMSASGRRFPLLGRKLLDRRALSTQDVHPEDSVLARHIDPVSRRMKSTYRQMIKSAFYGQWWNSKMIVPEDAPGAAEQSLATTGLVELAETLNANGPVLSQPIANARGWSHMEANFSLYFGLALQLYQATLVSDQTPYDLYAEGTQNALTKQQKLGLDVFFNKGKCANCHVGPEFTNATVSYIGKTPLERMIMGNKQEAIYDSGFYNIGVRPTKEDLGVGGQDPFGNPLAESRLAKLRGPDSFKKLIGFPPNLEVSPTERVAVDGAFKTPTLRNIELTAPYFHNGGTLTLLETVGFYNRGGDFFDHNIADADADIGRLGLTMKEKLALVEFMKALTDERVRYRRAPFDHPALYIPNGHVGNENTVTDDGFGAAVDSFLLLPATGRKGGTPFPNFLQ